MKSFLAFALFLSIAACHHDKPANGPSTGSTGSTTASTDEDMVDPTVPSWAPKSCIKYHAAVVSAVDCEALPQATRDDIKNKYEAANTSWHEMQNAEQGAIDQVGASCTDQNAAVSAAIAGKCEKAITR